MHPIVKLFAGLLVLVALWFGTWYMMLSADVARVQASIDFHDRQFKTVNRYVTFKADSVSRSGFPFHFRVKVKRPALTMIFGKETFGISTASLTLEPTDEAQGRYRLNLPEPLQAVYAKDGALPEQYTVTLAPVPPVLFRAAGDSNACSPFSGQAACPSVAADAPLVSYAIAYPNRLLLHVTRWSDSRDIGFDLVPLQVPLFFTIPANIAKPLEIAVNVFREAFEKPSP
ncbi:MAG: hypothetical protein ACKVOE_00150 [Rickettsiales bacterium]